MPSGWCGCSRRASCIAVAVPSVEEEALRDLVRAREDLRGDLMRARHRLAKLLLRHEVRFDGPKPTGPRRIWGGWPAWRLEQPASQRALEDYRGAVIALMIRREQLESEIARALPESPWAQTARRLMCLRGIDTLTAAGLCAEIGDFERFRHPAQVMSYLGVVPSEHSSGERRRRGPITKSGSQHARRLLVEAAWHYRRAPRVAGSLARRQTDGEPEIAGAVMEGAAAAASRLAADGATRQAPHDHRRRRRARARRILLGGRDRRLSATDSTRWSRRRRATGPSRQSIRDTSMGSRPARPVTPVPRRRALKTKPGPAVPNPRISG